VFYLALVITPATATAFALASMIGLGGALVLTGQKS